MSIEEISIQQAIDIIEYHTADFLETTKHLFQLGPYQKYRTSKPDFPILSPANDYYYSFKYFVETLEWYIRDNLANGIIYDLCSLYGIDLKVPNSNFIYAKFNNEQIESVRPFEFIISKKGRSVAYRYTDIGAQPRHIKKSFHKYHVDKIVVIDWDNNNQKQLSRLNKRIPTALFGRIEYISIQEFFMQYFPDGVFDEYLRLTREAVKKSHEEISIQVSPTLSLQYLSSFKAQEKERLSNFECRKARYIKSDLSELSPLPEEDYELIEAVHHNTEFYKALAGKERFAESFITSEYMYKVFENGGRFDYTAIVCGYIKSVEQLLEKLMDITVSYQENDDLWIKCKRFIEDYRIDNKKFKKGIVCDKKPRKDVHVRALKQYKYLFDTTFTPLTWFIYDNTSSWNISSDGISLINDYLLEYAKEDRNGHFHKDNISEIEDVERIRNNTILLLYLLLGGYKLTGNTDMDQYLLGMQDDSFDKLYKRLITLPSAIRYFIFDFGNGDELKVARLDQQDSPAYDSYGGFTSDIKFVTIDNYSIKGSDSLINSLEDDAVIIVSRTNLPEKVWFIKPDGERVELEW